MKEKDKHLSALGASIQQMRKIRGLSQEQVAFAAEVDRSYFGSIERGERNLTYLTLVKIAAALDCSISKLVNEIPNEDETAGN